MKTKKLMEQSILLAIDAIKTDICGTVDADENRTRAEAIKMLAEAYDIIHRGKRGQA